jgi:GDP-D-mannose dehydratase
MNKKVNLIIGSGVLGAYLSVDLIKKKERVIVTTRSLRKKIHNYNYLKIQKKVKFEKLDIKNKNSIKKIIYKYKPEKIFYFAGQSSKFKKSKRNFSISLQWYKKFS